MTDQDALTAALALLQEFVDCDAEHQKHHDKFSAWLDFHAIAEATRKFLATKAA